MKLKLVSFALALICLVAASSFASTVGKITGTVIDAENGEAIIGVTVSVQGTALGAITDVNGKYIILNVPVGTYTVVYSAVGYAKVEVSNVQVSADLAAYQDVDMTSQATELDKTIRVTAEEPMVVKDRTASIRQIDREELLRLPTRGFEQVVGIQSSVVRVQSNVVTRARGARESNQSGELNIRGGRPSDVAYYVDGFSTQDPLSGISTANISNNAIEEVQVIAGGFPAEYGHVTSGIVNTITSSGTDDYHATFEVVSDFAAPDRYDQNWYSADISGPVPGLDNANFFGSVERRWLGDRQPSSITNASLPGNPEILPNNDLSGWTWQGKLNFDVTPNIKLLFSTNGSHDVWREYQHNYLFNQEHIPIYIDDNMSINGKWTHTISRNTFYNIAASYFVTERFRGDGVLGEDLLAYGQPDGNPRFDERALFWDEGHIFDDFLRRKSSYIQIKGDINSQLGPYHTIKVGADFQRHTLRYYEHLFPSQLAGSSPNFNDIDRYGYDSLGNEIDEEADGTNAVKNPINIAGYVQDRFEWQDLIINAGLRLDIFDYKARRIRNLSNPFDPDDNNDAAGNVLDDADFQDSEIFTRLSPRLGIAFPVTDRTQLRLNYGQFFQRPDLAQLYVGDAYFEHKVNLGGYYYPFGNPNLQPEKTTQYELGLTHQVSDRIVFEATAYYKDVIDQIQVVTVAASPNTYSTFVNQDYGNVKGFEFSGEMVRTNNIALDFKYTLSWARGTGSYANTQQNIAWQSADPPKQTAPLAYDQRHNLTASVDWRTGVDGGPKIGDFHPLENFGVNFLIVAASGLPFSPAIVYNEVTLGATSPTPSAPRNSQYGPWAFFIDMKAEKNFRSGNFTITPYLWVKNLLDRENVINVYESTGRGNTTNWLATEAGQAFVEANNEVNDRGITGEQEYLIKQQNPQNYSNPRQVMLGLRVSF